MNYYHGKTVLITGASSGIGECFSKKLSEAGAFVLLSARRLNELQRVQSELAFPEKSEVFVMDMLASEELDEVCRDIISKHSVDIALLNAGISQRANVVDTHFEVEEKIWKTNYQGLTRITKNILPYFIKREAGHFVVMSSVTGKIGVPGRSSYSASKHALHGYFDSLRAEVYRYHIDVSIVCPGYIFTNISQNALTGNGERQAKVDENSRNGMEVEIFVDKAMKKIAQKKKEILIGGREIFAVYLKRFFPGILSRLIRNIKKP